MSSNATFDDFLTIDAASRYTGLSADSLRSRARRGKLTVVKPGPKCVLLSRAELASLLLAGEL